MKIYYNMTVLLFDNLPGLSRLRDLLIRVVVLTLLATASSANDMTSVVE